MFSVANDSVVDSCSEQLAQEDDDMSGFEEPTTPCSTSEISRSGTMTPEPVPILPQKRKTKSTSSHSSNVSTSETEVEQAVMDSIKGLHKMMKMHQETKNDPDVNFCLDVADQLKGMPWHKKALAKMRIQQILYDVEFAPAAENPVGPVISQLPMGLPQPFPPFPPT